jgi:hypothetical protein
MPLNVIIVPYSAMSVLVFTRKSNLSVSYVAATLRKIGRLTSVIPFAAATLVLDG